MFNPIKSRVNNAVDSYYVAKYLIAEVKADYDYEKMVRKMQRQIAKNNVPTQYRVIAA